MNKLTILLLFIGLTACKQNPKTEKNETPVQQEMVVDEAVYPDALTKVFDAHGGLKKWKSQRTVSFVLPKPNQSETHTIDLWTRKDRIDTEQFSMGFEREKEGQ